MDCLKTWRKKNFYLAYPRWHCANVPFVVRNNFQALPHPTSLRASVEGFNLSPVLTLCLFNGSFEGIAGILISVRISVLLLESSSSTL